jgi:5-formaminoimidazole-4-carboxamide-1-(beta)-D-ribofuranosyl 5'-monophosphate synthetase
MKSISALGSHSALDVCEGAKSEGFRTVVVAQKGRHRTYAEHYATKKAGARETGIVDRCIILDKFAEIASPETCKTLESEGTVFVPNRSFSVYVGYDRIEKDFTPRIFGNRFLLRAEERGGALTQYSVLEKAGLRIPRSVKGPEKIDRPCIVKVSEAKRKHERAFFIASSPEEYRSKSNDLLAKGIIDKPGLASARMEEFIMGAQVNLNFFYSKVRGKLELLGTDFRRQTSIDGLLRMPADAQLEALKSVKPSTIEVGHVACTLRESLLEEAFECGEKMLEGCRKAGQPLNGPFALQCAIAAEEKKETFVVFDASFRMPGSPGTRFTPYSSYLFREGMSFGRRIAIELKEASSAGVLDEVVSYAKK